MDSFSGLKFFFFLLLLRKVNALSNRSSYELLTKSTRKLDLSNTDFFFLSSSWTLAMEHQFQTNTLSLERQMGAQLCPKAFSCILKSLVWSFLAAQRSSCLIIYTREKTDFGNTFGVKIDSEILSRKPVTAKMVIECHSAYDQRSQTVLEMCSACKVITVIRGKIWVLCCVDSLQKAMDPMGNYLKWMVMSASRVFLGYLLKPPSVK